MEEKKMVVSEIVYQSIRDKIINQEWTPGMKITSEVQLSNELNVSRMSVREAIEKMVALNVLTKKRGGGTYVSDLSPSIYINGLIQMMLFDKDELLDVVEFRKVIEVDSAAMCAQRCDDSTILALEKYYYIMLENSKSSETFTDADHMFHVEIAKGTKNSLIIKVNEILTDIWRAQQKELNHYLGSSKGIEDHAKILAAIKNRDSELAALYMRRHLTRTIEEIREVKIEKS